MKALLAFLLLCVTAFAGQDTPPTPARIRDVSLQKLPLKEGERIAALEVEVAGARFRGVRIPDDWGFVVSPPVSDVSILKGAAQHGVAMLFTSSEFQRFASLAFYESREFHQPFTIKVTLVAYRYDKGEAESERRIELPSECIVLH